MTDHERQTNRELLSEAAYCLRGLAHYTFFPIRRARLCRVGVHEWCSCCSPVTCVRCGANGHD